MILTDFFQCLNTAYEHSVDMYSHRYQLQPYREQQLDERQRYRKHTQEWWILLMCFNKLEMLKFCSNVVYLVFVLAIIRLLMGASFFVKNVFENYYHEDCVRRYIQNLLIFPPFSVILSIINVVYHFYTFLATNKVYLSLSKNLALLKSLNRKNQWMFSYHP